MCVAMKRLKLPFGCVILLVLSFVVLIFVYRRAAQTQELYHAIQPDREELKKYFATTKVSPAVLKPAGKINSASVLRSSSVAPVSQEATPQPFSLSLPTSRFISASCANPEGIIVWRGTGLVTTLYPPVEANCRQLQAGNSTESIRVRSALKIWANSVSDQTFYKKLTKCSYVKNLFSPSAFYISETERNFPLAYVLLFHNSPQQIVRLLKVIYRPQNIYCLHPDGKASRQMIQAIRQLASCLDNVFVPRELVKVTYMHFSMVEAQMLCFQQLATMYKHWQWKYVMNLCGKELPFRLTG